VAFPESKKPPGGGRWHSYAQVSRPSVRPIRSRYCSLTCAQNLESLAVLHDAVINEAFTVRRITLRLSCCLS
jgi:hypothetical protein